MASRLAAAFAMFLAIAEVFRNWGDWGYWPFWLVDYIAVALLLIGARAAQRGSRSAAVVLAGAWGFTCSMFYISFFSHLSVIQSNQGAESHGPLSEGFLTVTIGVLFVVTILGFGHILLISTRHAG